VKKLYSFWLPLF